MTDDNLEAQWEGRAKKLEKVDQALAGIQPQLTWIVDALVPADRELGMPSASEAGVLDRHLREALLKRDDLMPSFITAVSRLPAGRPADPLGSLRSLETQDFDICTRVIAGAYFSDEKVNRTLKYPGQQSIISTPDYDVIIDAIDSVLNRGQLYIATP